MNDAVIWRAKEPLARHSARRVGGPCDAWVLVHDPARLHDTLQRIRDEGLVRTVVGACTRWSARDGGVAGAVVRLGLGFSEITQAQGRVWVGAAVGLARLAHVQGAGWERLSASPGSFGASLRLDDGWPPWVDRVRVHVRGGVREMALEEARSVASSVFLGAWLHSGLSVPAPVVPHPWAVLESGQTRDAAQIMRQAGLANTRLRAWLVPQEEPSSVVNLGDGNAADYALLSRSIRERVKKEQGVDLQETLIWAGRP